MMLRCVVALLLLVLAEMVPSHIGHLELGSQSPRSSVLV